jgi:glyoxylase-like metal-dependent hydrolase (beta-lactamase superfamily II)
MKLHTLEGATQLFRGGTNSGIYHLSNDKILIIDPGLSESRGQRFVTYAKEAQKTISHIIASHEHSDHIGAISAILKDFPQCQVLIDRKGKYIFEEPDTFLAYINGGGPNHELRGFFRPLEFDFTIKTPLEEGYFTIDNSTFKWLYFGGHSIGSGGLITPDHVLFLGDTLIPSEILKKFKLPLLYSVENQYRALEKLKTNDYKHCVIGHGRKTLSKDETILLARENIDVMEHCIQLLLKAVQIPKSKETLMRDLVEELQLKLNYKEYLFGMSSVGSMLSYLIDRDLVTVILSDGHLLYKMK